MIQQTLLSSGEEYGRIPKLITINILNFSIFPSTEPYHTSYHLYNDESKRLLTDALEIHFIELPKIPKYYSKHEPLLRWLLMMKAVEWNTVDDLIALKEVDPVLASAMNLWESISKDPEHWAYYISREKELRDVQNITQNLDRAVKLLLKSGMTVEDIAKELSMSVEDIEHIKNE